MKILCHTKICFAEGTCSRRNPQSQEHDEAGEDEPGDVP